MVVGTGFEPVKAMPADLQSAPVGRLGIPPMLFARGGNYATAARCCQLREMVLFPVCRFSFVSPGDSII